MSSVAIRPVHGMPLLLERQADRDHDRRSKQLLQRADQTVERVDQVLDRLERRFGKADALYRERLLDRREPQT